MTNPAFRQPDESRTDYVARRAEDPRTNEQIRTDREAITAAERALDRAHRYSAARLIAERDNPDPVFPGPARRAGHLLELDTPARRARADSEANTLGNLRPGGRPSDDVREAVQALKALIAEGREDAELYGERTARLYREQQQADSAAQHAAAAAFFRAKSGG